MISYAWVRALLPIGSIKICALNSEHIISTRLVPCVLYCTDMDDYSRYSDRELTRNIPGVQSRNGKGLLPRDLIESRNAVEI
jgi:hypothetical protein